MPPAYAEEDEGGGNTTAVANPQAVSSGNVTNQAVQVTNTNLFQQHYGSGVSCQGTTFALSPFYIGGFGAPEGNVKNDFGIAATITMPLDREAVDECKRRAMIETVRQRAEADKAQLDYQLVRALKCAEMIRGGAFLHPSSPYGAVCADVIALGPDDQMRNGIGQVVTQVVMEPSRNQAASY